MALNLQQRRGRRLPSGGLSIRKDTAIAPLSLTPHTVTRWYLRRERRRGPATPASLPARAPRPSRIRLEFGHVWRFACVGVAGAAVNTGLLWWLTEQAGLHYLLASVAATEIAIVNNFALNHAWTFDSLRDAESMVVKFGRYNACSLSGVALMAGGLFLLTHLLGLHYLVANVLASGGCGVWNYALSRFVVWRAPTAPTQAGVAHAP